MVSPADSPGKLEASAPTGGNTVAEIKGSSLLDSIQAIKRLGESELMKVTKHLSPETKRLFDQQIYQSSWYPLDAFTEFLEVYVREMAGGDRSVLMRRSERITEAQLRGIYKIFIKFGSPGFVISRISGVHATYFRGVQIIPEVERNSATIKYVGFQKHHELMECIILGFFRKALEISGAKHVTLKFTIPISLGQPYSELTINWQ